jgi:uncharacterized membrane protein (UPF0127 family)
MDEIEIRTDKHSLKADLAENVLHHCRGMRFRTEGKMLFKFPRENQAAIDMLAVPKPLELYFIDSDGRVVESQTARPVTPNPFTWKLYRPDATYQYLLESFEPLDIQEGEKVDFEL